MYRETLGAEVRLRAVPELFSEMVISQNQHWGKHRSETQDELEAELDDLGWADGFAFGTPTRFGNVAAQLKLFMDQAGGLWEQGELVNKVGTAFTASQTAHGGRNPQSSRSTTRSTTGAPSCCRSATPFSEVYDGGGNPYGASFVTEGGIHGGPDERALTVARAQGRRLTRVASVIARARDQGLLEARAGLIRDPLGATAAG